MLINANGLADFVIHKQVFGQLDDRADSITETTLDARAKSSARSAQRARDPRHRPIERFGNAATRRPLFVTASHDQGRLRLHGLYALTHCRNQLPLIIVAGVRHLLDHTKPKGVTEFIQISEFSPLSSIPFRASRIQLNFAISYTAS
jgi:hypothetical protein